MSEDLIGHVKHEQWLGASVLSYSNRPRTLTQILQRAVNRFPESVFLTDDEVSITYRQFAELVQGAVKNLADRGLRPGDRFAIAARNSIDIVVGFFAAASAELILVGLNTRLAAPQWSYQLSHSGAKLAFAQPEYQERLREAAKGLAVSVEVLGPQLSGSPQPWPSDGAFDNSDEGSTYAVVYTSGTTGDPKASQLVQRATIHSGLSYYRLWQFNADDVCAVVFPLHYISSMHAHIVPTMLAGGRCVLVKEPQPTAIQKAVVTENVTILYLVPALWQRMLNLPDFRWPAVPQLRIGAFGGSPAAPVMIDDLRRHLPQVRLHDVYGLSETHSPATMLLDAEFHRKPGSVGRPLPCMEACVVDAGGTTSERGAVGELLLKGSLVTSGYFGNPEATKAAIVEGWFHTGDIARIDEEGYVYILDRLKDVIVRGGQNVFSSEVERIIAGHPKVSECAVVGVPNPVGGEAVVAFVVPVGQEVPALEELRALVRQELADYASPRHLYCVDELPRNATGKVLKRELRDRAVELLNKDRP